MNPVNVTIPANLVQYLRRGVKRELSATLAILAIQVDLALDQTTYYNALTRFDNARALFDTIGVTDEPEQVALELDLSRWPRLLLRALETEYDIEVMRLQDRAAEGFNLSPRELPALGSLLAEIRKKVGEPPGRRTRQSFMKARRGIRGGRGDG